MVEIEATMSDVPDQTSEGDAVTADAPVNQVTEPKAEEIEKDYLDLSGLELSNLDSFQLASKLTHLDLTQNRMKSIDPKVLNLPNLKNLQLRQNVLTDAEPLTRLANPAAMTELVLNDNQIEELIPLEQFTSMEYFDISFNQIRSIANAAGLRAAQPREVFFANNKITAIEGLSELTALTSLELGSNRLRSMEGVEALVQLEQLYVGRNKLTAITCLQGMTNLKILSLQSNRFTQISGLEACVSLEELYLSHNGIAKMEGLASLTNLNTLDIAANKITQIEGLATLSKLEHLWLNDNLIETLDGLADALLPVRNILDTIYLERNPAQGNDPEYKEKILAAVPNLVQLDANILKR